MSPVRGILFLQIIPFSPRVSQILNPACVLGNFFVRFTNSVSMKKLFVWYFSWFSKNRPYGLWADAFYKLQCLSVCVSVCLFVCLFTFEILVKRLFSLTSQSQMSKIIRDSEFLGQSNGKKWSHLWKLWLIKGVKLLRQKSKVNFQFFVFFLAFLFAFLV